MGSIQGSADRIADPPGFRGGPQFLLCQGGSVSSRGASGRLRRPRARDRRLRRLRCIGPAKRVWAFRYLRCGNGRFSALVHPLRKRKARCGRERRDARGDQSVFHCDLYRLLLVKMPRVQHTDKSAGNVYTPTEHTGLVLPLLVVVCCCGLFLRAAATHEKVMGSGRNKKFMLALPGSEPFLRQSEKCFYDQCLGRNPPWQSLSLRGR